MNTRDKAFFFVTNFLKWYKDSFGQQGETIRLALNNLVKEAEDIHKAMLEEINQELDKRNEFNGVNVVKLDEKEAKKLKKQLKSAGRKRISKYF